MWRIRVVIPSFLRQRMGGVWMAFDEEVELREVEKGWSVLERVSWGWTDIGIFPLEKLSAYELNRAIHGIATMIVLSVCTIEGIPCLVLRRLDDGLCPKSKDFLEARGRLVARLTKVLRERGKDDTPDWLKLPRWRRVLTRWAHRLGWRWFPFENVFPDSFFS